MTILKDPEETLDKLAEWTWKNGGSVSSADIHNETAEHVGSIVGIFLPGVDRDHASAYGTWMIDRFHGKQTPPPEGQKPAATVTVDHQTGQASVQVFEPAKAPMVKLIIKQALDMELPTSVVPNQGPNRHARRMMASSGKRTWANEVGPGTRRGRGKA